MMMMMATPPRAGDDDLFAPEPVEPFDPLRFLFTTATVAGARAFAEGLGACPEVWELRGAYYPVQRRSPEAEILSRAGAELVPPADDHLHMELDGLLQALQRTDSGQ